jgi:hypothetical protein
VASTSRAHHASGPTDRRTTSAAAPTTTPSTADPSASDPIVQPNDSAGGA